MGFQCALVRTGWKQGATGPGLWFEQQETQRAARGLAAGHPVQVERRERPPPMAQVRAVLCSMTQRRKPNTGTRSQCTRAAAEHRNRTTKAQPFHSGEPGTGRPRTERMNDRKDRQHTWGSPANGIDGEEKSTD
ncbi:hypothetical protein Nepgr_001931 [Nepenthes gracilis]|uniref:Uncharacterized protein n=1 Tax=Nepenthes gracilis TaxID=150966 RepID=A0AAD3RWE9_NEPGR|nr:hypothetical protein Nepgr_001931 [Nepenthes gracilis]